MNAPTEAQGKAMYELLAETFGERDGGDVAETIRDSLEDTIGDIGKYYPDGEPDKQDQLLAFYSRIFVLFSHAVDAAEAARVETS